MEYNVGITGMTPEQRRVLEEIRDQQEKERLAVEAERRRMIADRDEIVRAAREADQKIRNQRDSGFEKLTRMLAERFNPIELGEIALQLESVDLRKFSYHLTSAISAGRAAQIAKAEAEKEAAHKANNEYVLAQHEAHHRKMAEAELLRGLPQ